MIAARTIALAALATWAGLLSIGLLAFWDADITVIVLVALIPAALVAAALSLINLGVAAQHERQARAFRKTIDGYPH